MYCDLINKKIKLLNSEWIKQTIDVENKIKQELINAFIEKYGVNAGDDILIVSTRYSYKTNKTTKYYRKAKLKGFNTSIYLKTYEEKNPSIYFRAIIYPYKNKNTLQKKPIVYFDDILKLDLNLVGKEAIA